MSTAATMSHPRAQSHVDEAMNLHRSFMRAHNIVVGANNIIDAWHRAQANGDLRGAATNVRMIRYGAVISPSLSSYCEIIACIAQSQIDGLVPRYVECARQVVGGRMTVLLPRI
jgi:hypothetical protein